MKIEVQGLINPYYPSFVKVFFNAKKRLNYHGSYDEIIETHIPGLNDFKSLYKITPIYSDIELHTFFIYEL